MRNEAYKGAISVTLFIPRIIKRNSYQGVWIVIVYLYDAVLWMHAYSIKRMILYYIHDLVLYYISII